MTMETMSGRRAMPMRRKKLDLFSYQLRCVTECLIDDGEGIRRGAVVVLHSVVVGVVPSTV